MPLLNDVVARVLIAATPLGAALATRAMARRIARFPQEQAELRRRYGITPDTPVRGYDDDTRARVRAFAAATPGARLATTSGTTGEPKEIAYTPERLAGYRRDSTSIAVRAYARLRVRRPGMFILASMKADDSFASLVLHGRGASPPWLAGLVEPSRWLSHPALVARTAEHGATAVRLWLMLVASPGMLYATNPSTVAAFFGDVVERWRESTALVRRSVDGGDLATDPGLRRIIRGVAADGWRARLEDVARSPAPLPVERMLPALTAWCGWDGGYVKAFLPEVYRHLPPERIAHLPMYSMSTEAIETLTWFADDADDDEAGDEAGDENGARKGRGAVRFLPLGPGVLYELLPDGAPDDPASLLLPAALHPGQVYSMVVSDPWGLRRYQTEDLFECRGMVRGLPDLRFLRRRGLAYSFTGEKLTGEQLALAYDELRARFPGLASGVELVCFPSHEDGERVPGYRLVIAPTTARTIDVELGAVAAALDEILARLNTELAAKQRSGRLTGTRALVVPYGALAIALDRRTENEQDVSQRAWESQFKLAPLVKKRWEDVAPRLLRPTGPGHEPSA